MDAIVASRNAILQDIRTYERNITDLKGRLNTLTPIGRLPTELLSEVLVATAHACYERDVARLYRSARLSCIDLTLVCRQWHAVAFKTPRFWSYIYVNKFSIFAKLVQLSMNAPLVVDLRLSRDEHRFSSTAIPATEIAQLMNRVRSITVHGDVSYLEALFQDPNTSPMLLEHLSLSTDGGRPSNAVPSSQSLFTTIGPTPRLHSVHLTRVPFLWSDPVFAARLTSLSIRDNMRLPNPLPKTDHGPMEGFLAMLESVSPTLGSLTLEEAFPSLSSPTTEPSPVAHPFPFPSLRSLVLIGETNVCAQFLNHISTQRIEEIHISAHGKPGAGVLTRTVSELLRSRPLLSIALRREESDWRNPGLTIEGWRSLKITSSAPVKITVFGDVIGDAKSSPLHLTHLTLNAAPTLFSHVQSLRTFGLRPTTPGWTLLFSCATNIRTLAVESE